MQSPNCVIIKGVREGLLFILDDDMPFSRVLTELSERISAKTDFFKGASVTINAGRRIMDRPEFDVIYKMLTRHGMRVSSFVSLSAQSRMVAEGFGVTSRPPSFATSEAGAGLGPTLRDGRPENVRPVPGQPETEAEIESGIFLRRNVRQGELVRYRGDVCVLGDVEAGAEIIAGGDIVVWGALLGAAHAGVNSNDKAVVCALFMSPTQLGIAGCTSTFLAQEAGHRVSGDRHASEELAWESEDRADVSEKYHLPSLARIEAGRIIVRAWNRDEYAEHKQNIDTIM